MPRIEYRPSRPSPPRRVPPAPVLLFRVFLILALALALVIVAGTVYALAIRPKSIPQAAEQPASAPRPAGTSAQAVSPDAAIFTGLGRLRCPTAGPNPGLVILQASFPYFPGDRPFSEELASRLRDFRSLTTTYFAALSPGELRNKGEDEVKADLLANYNALLRLGRIRTLYFNEYMLIE
jgi:flagellar basal body-associated protein FliL